MTIESSDVMNEKRKTKINQVQSRSISYVGGRRSYADICRLCTIVDDSIGMQCSIAIKLIKLTEHELELARQENHEPSEWQ